MASTDPDDPYVEMFAAAARPRLAEAMEQRRDQLGLTWVQVSRRGGISPETLKAARQSQSQLTARSKRRIEIGLQWPRGAVELAQAGKDIPVPDYVLSDEFELRVWANLTLSDEDRTELIRAHRAMPSTSPQK